MASTMKHNAHKLWMMFSHATEEPRADGDHSRMKRLVGSLLYAVCTLGAILICYSALTVSKLICVFIFEYLKMCIYCTVSSKLDSKYLSHESFVP